MVHQTNCAESVEHLFGETIKVNPNYPGCKYDAHFSKSYFEVSLLGWICAVYRRMLHSWRGRGFDCLLTLVSIKMNTIVCILYIIYDTHRGARGIRVLIAKSVNTLKKSYIHWSLELTDLTHLMVQSQNMCSLCV